jgi:NAD(P)-dependent dehydrogenase (short-subunit alcohol dehydrogenase family)
MRLRDKVVVITGGARGIGGSTAKLFAAEGAKVVVADLLRESGDETVAAIRAAGGEAIFVRTDVSRAADCRALMSAAIETYGKLDVLVTCAGVLRGAFVPVDELEEEVFESVLDTNVTGTFLTIKHAVPYLKKCGRGVIVSLASGAGVKSPSSSCAYGSSKGAVHGLVMTLEPRLEPLGIRINDVCPGAIDTEMKRENVLDGARAIGLPTEGALESARLADPAGVARVLLFLASDDADYVRGTVFTR